MNTRLRRVQQMLQREIASVLVEGGLRDPRVRDNAASISVTGVDVSPDLSTARVFIDVLGGASVDDVLEGLNAGARALRGQLRERVRLKRLPSLRFFHDASIAHGANIERVLAEIAAERDVPADDDDDDDDDGDDDDGDDEADDEAESAAVTDDAP